MKQFAVIGLGRFGTSVASTLMAMGHEVLVIDEEQEKIQEVANLVTHAIQADAKDENALKALGIRNFDVVIVAIGKDTESSILVTVLLKDLGVKCVVAKAQNELHGKVLGRVGADKVVFPERDMGARVAHQLASSNVLDHIELSPEFSILEIVAPEVLVGQTLRKYDLRAKFGITILALKRGTEILVSPSPDAPIIEGDILVAIGENKRLRSLERE